MPLYTLTYISRAPQMRGEARKVFLNELVKLCDRKNLPIGVSGCLVHVDDFFIQVLEGPRGAVSETYNRICKDERHEDVHLVHVGPLLSRQFATPHMAAFDIGSDSNPLLLRYKVRPQFCPYQLAPNALLDLIEEIADVCAKLDSANRKARAGKAAA